MRGMRGAGLTVCLAAALASACAARAPGRAPPEPIELARLDELDRRYLDLERALALARWERATSGGASDEEVESAQRALTAFWRDDTIDRLLEPLAGSANAEVRARSARWQALRSRMRLAEDPALLEATEAVLRILRGDDGGEPPMEALWTLYASPEAQARAAALGRIADLSPALAESLRARGRALQRVSTSLDPGPRSGPQDVDLAGICRAQIASTEADWAALLARGRAELGREPGLADFLAISTIWTGTTGSFLEPEAVDALARLALSEMGFQAELEGIMVVRREGGPGGSAYGVSIPDDVRFQGNFPPGYEGARGWFHELGHAVHMRAIVATDATTRRLPDDLSITEGLADLLALPLWDPGWLRASLPGPLTQDLREYRQSVSAFDALAVRYNCLFAQLEEALYRQETLEESFSSIHRSVFGVPPTTRPAFVMLPYLEEAHQLRQYVLAREARDEIRRRLGDVPLVSPRAGRFLRETLMAPGGALDAETWWRQPVSLADWEVARAQP